MKWLMYGKVFDPTQHALPNGCVEFAQSPQALVFDEFVRVYFSTRAKDTNGKFLSHVAYVDFRKDLREIVGVAQSPVLPLGELGCFDEHGIFPINVVRDGPRVLAYTTGWSRRVSVSVETAIGLCTSGDNGKTFQRVGSGPVMAASLCEPCLVGDGFVKKISGVFHMWYIFGTGWKCYVTGSAPDRTYKIGHATSSDGLNWMKEEARQIIPDSLGSDESQALPTVARIGDKYHMFFCYRESFDFRRAAGRGYRIGHAVSDDLTRWDRDDSVVPPPGRAGEWDSDMQCYPHIFECEGQFFLLYNGNEFGRQGFGLARLER